MLINTRQSYKLELARFVVFWRGIKLIKYIIHNTTGWILLKKITDASTDGQLKKIKFILQRLATVRSGDRNPVGARFSSPIQTSPGAHPASYTMGTGSFQGVERPGRDVNHPPTPSAEVKERVQLYFHSLLGFTICYLMNFTVTFTLGRPRSRGSG